MTYNFVACQLLQHMICLEEDLDATCCQADANVYHQLAGLAYRVVTATG